MAWPLFMITKPKPNLGCSSAVPTSKACFMLYDTGFSEFLSRSSAQRARSLATLDLLAGFLGAIERRVLGSSNLNALFDLQTSHSKRADVGPVCDVTT